MSSFLEKRKQALQSIANEKIASINPFSGTGNKQQTISGSSLLESVAAMEHEKWCCLAKTLIDRGDVTGETAERWQTFFKPYNELPEGVKYFSRDNAKKTLNFFGDFFKNM